MFAGTGIQVTSAGWPYLGAPIGSQDFVTDFTQNHVSQWVQGLSQLSSIAVTQPHAAYAVLVHGFSSKRNYYLQTNPNINDQLPPLELAIRQKFLSTMIPHPPSDLERELFSLPVSLGICDPHQVSGEHYSFSCELSHPLVDLILQQYVTLPHDVIDSQCVILKQLSQAKHQSQVDTVQLVLARSPHNLRLALECCQEKGASSWLSAIPAWVCTSQDRFYRCSVFTLWLDPTTLTFSLCLWQSLYSFSRFQLPARCFSHHPP